MKAALSTWEGRISPVFDVSRQALVLTIEGGVVTSRQNVSIEATAPAAKIDRLVSLGVETLICGAISRPLHCELTTRGMKVIAFTAGAVDDVVASFLAGRLPSETFSMPGCCQRQEVSRRGRGRGNRAGRGWGCRRGQG
jgi:predicted Fe-Mo cluster-binding NifX family protein